MTEIDLLRERYQDISHVLAYLTLTQENALTLLSERADIVLRLSIEFDTTPHP